MTCRQLIIGLLLCGSGCYANTVIVLFTGLPSTVENGTYNGFAEATVNGIPAQLLICDDYSHTTYVPSSDLIYDYADFKGNADSIQTARFISDSGPTAMDVFKYEEASVLLYGLVHQASAPAAITDNQYAIWNLFTPSVQLFRPSQETLQAQALAAITSNAPYLSAAYTSLAIYTPFNGNGQQVDFSSNQEFLQYRPTPEPTGLMPLGAFLLVGLIHRKPRTA